MTKTSSSHDRAAEEVWKAFARTAETLPPDQTTTTQTIEATVVDAGGALGMSNVLPFVGSPAPAAITLPDLPYLAVEPTGSPRATQGETAGPNADFEITGVLGEGGMGRVLLARQR